MSNLVLFGELRQRLDEHLERVSRIAAEGDAGSALFVMRQDVPGLVAAPCRMLLDVHLAAEAATKARGRHRSQPSSVD